MSMSDQKRKVKNIVEPAHNSRSMFLDGFSERFDLEQYFWTENTVKRLMNALEYVSDCCCLTTPSLGVGFHEMGREEVVLDIDTRFEFLPKFRYFDLRIPFQTEESFQVIIVDPPFFYISLDIIKEAVLTIAKGDTSVKLLIGFLKREEAALLHHFQEFNLRETNFHLEYATVKPNKWKNYSLYSNIDLPGIKRHSIKT
jgi:hypothetical protein